MQLKPGSVGTNMPNKKIKTSFNAGEMSEHISAREDHKKYYNGCSVLENAVPLPYGGATRRPGTEHIKTAKGAHRLIPFEFSVDDAMILEMGNNYVRFLKDDDYETIGNPTNAWADDTAYEVNDMVSFGGNYYYCIEDHTSTADLAGTDAGGGDAAVLTDTGAFAGLDLTGLTVTNTTDGSSGTITANDDDTVTATLSGGTDNDWDSGDSYIISMTLTYDSDKWVQLTTSGGSKVIYELYQPYSSTEIFGVQFVTSGDVIYMSHEDHYPQKLTRLADNSWTVEDAPFTGGPFLDENTDSTLLMGFARTGGTARSGWYFPVGATGTLTASQNAPFKAGHVGSLWRLVHTRQGGDIILTAFDNDTNATPSGTGIKIKGDFTLDVDYSSHTIILWRKEGNKGWHRVRQFTADTIYTGTENIDDTYYTVTRAGASGTFQLIAKDADNVGIVKVTEYNGPTVVSVEVVKPVYSNNTNNNAVTTSVWSEGAWSTYRGFPRAIGFYENRLFFGGSTYKPQTLWSSKSADYEDFLAGSLDDDAIVFTLSPTGGGDISNIQWIAAREIMFVGTASTEFQLSASNSSNPMTPTDVKAVDKSYVGSALMQPKILNNALFFAQHNGRKIRELRFDLEVEQYSASDATMLNPEMFESAPVVMAVQNVPDSILWVVKENGELASFTYEPAEDVWAWARHETRTGSYVVPSRFKSIAIVRGSIEDDIYVTVQRVIDGSTVYYIEKFTTRLYDQLDESIMLDCTKSSLSEEGSQEIICAADTVRYGEGLYGSGLYGGTP